METKIEKEKKKKSIKKIRPKVNLNKEEKRTISFSLVEMIVVVIIISLVVSIISGFLVFKNYDLIAKQTNQKDTYSELNEFIKVYDELKEKYVEDIDSEALIKAAIDGMLNYLDIYTDYLDEETTSDLQERLEGEYKGIGVEISNNNDGQVIIVNVFKNTPAEKAGLKSGDIFVEINGESMEGKTSSDVANTIKNSNLKEVKIKYERDGETKETTINVEHVIIPSVEYDVLEENIGYLNITTFSSTTYSQVKIALDEFESKKINSLIIDVRNNSGGYLSAAETISDLFLEKGKIIYKLKSKDGIIKNYEAKNESKTTYPIRVLINEGSASASEILAGALRDSYGAKLVGVQSFGKGTIQQIENLSSGDMIKYTSAYWITPSGENINKIGLKPDIEAENTENNDEQLKKAIESLK